MFAIEQKSLGILPCEVFIQNGLVNFVFIFCHTHFTSQIAPEFVFVALVGPHGGVECYLNFKMPHFLFVYLHSNSLVFLLKLKVPKKESKMSLLHFDPSPKICWWGLCKFKKTHLKHSLVKKVKEKYSSWRMHLRWRIKKMSSLVLYLTFALPVVN